MEAPFALLVGLFFATSIYLMMSKSLIRILIGFSVLSNAVNLLIFTAGRLTPQVPPIIAPDAARLAPGTANPLPQALILTAIVISFSLFAYLLVLAMRAYQALGTDMTPEMREAEPPGATRPPAGY